MAKGRSGTLLKWFYDDYYGKTITGKALGTVIRHMTSPATDDPKLKKRDRRDAFPRRNKEDRK